MAIFMTPPRRRFEGPMQDGGRGADNGVVALRAGNSLRKRAASESTSMLTSWGFLTPSHSWNNWR